MSHMSPTLIHTNEELQTALAQLRSEGKRLALVPTMGALHAGHLSLIDKAKEHADAVLVTIFVNPLQFGEGEDFDAYPRNLKKDVETLATYPVSIIYAPQKEDMFPEATLTKVHVDGVSKGLCGNTRAGHFDGVATIVTKLFMRTRPDVAVFGEKDYQQLAVIRRMVADLDIPVEILSAPTLREKNGLALSSRNAYLTPEERKIAPRLYATLDRIASELHQEPNRVSFLLGTARDTLQDAKFDMIEYISLVDAQTLTPLKKLDRPARLLAAAWLGKTRLIDNVEVLAP